MGTRIEHGKLIFPDGTVQESAARVDSITDVTASRSLDTTYTNGTKIRFAVVSVRLTPTATGAATAQAKIHATADPPTTIVGQVYQANETNPHDIDVILAFFISPSWKYKIITTVAAGSAVALSSWAEWDLF